MQVELYPKQCGSFSTYTDEMDLVDLIVQNVIRGREKNLVFVELFLRMDKRIKLLEAYLDERLAEEK